MASIETSTFGSEFMAMKQATEYLQGLIYKLRMFGIPIDEPAFVCGDNQSGISELINAGVYPQEEESMDSLSFRSRRLCRR